ncbi:MAG: isoprenylcysteine carboxylmethyltransferase family protein [Gammaproteobacteria bacterium]|nr:isoprenylcysteine carboxylmethyltransferase family protein [Gammaproteobacteria bacterium]
MKKLELLIPPVMLVFIFMLLMSVISQRLELALLPALNEVAFIFALLGAAIAILGVLSFKQAKTTVNPTKPENSTSIVDTGVYRFTRNPMYLGMFLFLIGFGFYLSSLPALIFSLLFVPYMTRFQILPEERVLSETFGNEYKSYQHRVRRWL